MAIVGVKGLIANDIGSAVCRLTECCEQQKIHTLSCVLNVTNLFFIVAGNDVVNSVNSA